MEEINKKLEAGCRIEDLTDEEKERVVKHLVERGIIHIKRKTDGMTDEEKLKLISEDFSSIGIPQRFLPEKSELEEKEIEIMSCITLNIKELLEDGTLYLKKEIHGDILDIIEFTNAVSLKTNGNIILLDIYKRVYIDDDKYVLKLEDKENNRLYIIDTEMEYDSGSRVVSKMEIIYEACELYTNAIDELNHEIKLDTENDPDTPYISDWFVDEFLKFINDEVNKFKDKIRRDADLI